VPTTCRDDGSALRRAGEAVRRYR